MGLHTEEDGTYMGRLKILASGSSPQAQAQARGKLFEKLMANVLRHYGYSIDRIASVNYAGMEIDIRHYQGLWRTISQDNSAREGGPYAKL
jgi:hypothetical protein